MFEFILVFTQQADVLFYYDHSGELARIIADCRQGLEDEVVDCLEDRDILMQLFSPMVASYTSMQEQRHWQYRSIEFQPIVEPSSAHHCHRQMLVMKSCANCLLLAMYKSSEEDWLSMEVLQEYVDRIAGLFHHLYGPCWEFLRRMSASMRQGHVNMLRDLMKEMWTMQKREFQVDFQAVEWLYLNDKIRVLAVDVLRKMIRKLLQSQFNFEYLMLVVGSRVMSLTSSESTRSLLDADSLLFLTNLINVVTSSASSSPSRTRPLPTAEKLPRKMPPNPFHRRLNYVKARSHLSEASEESESYFTPDESSSSSSDESNSSPASHMMDASTSTLAHLASSSSSASSKGYKDQLSSSTDLSSIKRSRSSSPSPPSRGPERYAPLLQEVGDNHRVVRVLLSSHRHGVHSPYNVHLVHLAPTILLVLLEPLPRSTLAITLNSHIVYLHSVLLSEASQRPDVFTDLNLKGLMKIIHDGLVLIGAQSTYIKLTSKPRSSAPQMSVGTRQSLNQLKVLTERWEVERTRHNSEVGNRSGDTFGNSHFNILVNVLLNLSTMFVETFLQPSRLCSPTTVSLVGHCREYVSKHLHDYFHFLSARAERNIPPTNYYTPYPGLVHFLHLNCRTEKLISPQMDGDFITHRPQRLLHRHLVWCRQVAHLTSACQLSLVTSLFRITYQVVRDLPGSSSGGNGKKNGQDRRVNPLAVIGGDKSAPQPRMIIGLVHLSSVPEKLANQHMHIFIQRMDPASEDSIYSLGLLT